MKKNMGKVDRIIRLAIAILIAILVFTNIISGTLAMILGVVVIIFLLTSLIGVCLLYIPFGASTRMKS